MHYQIRKQVAYYMRKLYQRKLTTITGGNISIRINDKLIAISPGSIDKSNLEASQVALMDFTGKGLSRNLKLSIESQMHLAILKARADVTAIVHAHPPFTSCFTASDAPLHCDLLAETEVILGKPVLAPYAVMGSEELAINTAEAAKKGNVILMENHGICCLGKNILQAFDRVELLENAAKMNIALGLTGKAKPLTQPRKDELAKLFSF